MAGKQHPATLSQASGQSTTDKKFVRMKKSTVGMVAGTLVANSLVMVAYASGLVSFEKENVDIIIVSGSFFVACTVAVFMVNLRE